MQLTAQEYCMFSHCKSLMPYTTAAVLLLTWTTAFDPLTSKTCPDRIVPSARWSWTISAYLGNFTSSKITNGPFTPETVLYAANYNHFIKNKNEWIHSSMVTLMWHVSFIHGTSLCCRYILMHTEMHWHQFDTK